MEQDVYATVAREMQYEDEESAVVTVTPTNTRSLPLLLASGAIGALATYWAVQNLARPLESALPLIGALLAMDLATRPGGPAAAVRAIAGAALTLGKSSAQAEREYGVARRTGRAVVTGAKAAATASRVVVEALLLSGDGGSGGGGGGSGGSAQGLLDVPPTPVAVPGEQPQLQRSAHDEEAAEACRLLRESNAVLRTRVCSLGGRAPPPPLLPPDAGAAALARENAALLAAAAPLLDGTTVAASTASLSTVAATGGADADADAGALRALTLRELRAIARDLKVRVAGRKEELVGRILAAQRAAD